MTVSTLVLTGTVGAGKTTIAEAVSEIWHERGIRHALLDLDWLGQVYPPLDPEDPYDLSLAFRNLEAIWPNLVETGIERAVVAATLERPEQLQGLRNAVSGAAVTLVRVVAEPRLIRSRIEARELGGLKQDFLARTDALAETIAAAFPDHLVVRNEETPRSAAADLIDRLDGSSRP